MSDSLTTDWLALAREHRIDPEEIRLVYSRFDAQQQFYADGRGEAMGLVRWFRFYRLEKMTEGRQAGPVPGDCSVDGEAVENACIDRPAEFLQVLEAYAAAAAD